MKRAIIWFRNDLRLHDNEALIDAIKNADEIIPVYILDDRLIYGKTSFGFDKIGSHRLRFLLESIKDLRQSLEKLGSTLVVRSGITEEIIPAIAREYKTSWVFCNRERTDEEISVQDALEHNLWTIGQEIRYYRGKMLYYTADLPFPVTHTPDQFSAFRKEVEKFVTVRCPLDAPLEDLPKIPEGLDNGLIPSLSELGVSDPFPVNNTYFKGGESVAIQQLNYYLWESNLIAQYKETRNGLLGRDYSSKFSAWLSLGCLSPKKIYQEVSKYEEERKKNDSTYWLKFELLWRDFFRLMGKRYGNKIFHYKGTHGDMTMPPAAQDMKLFRVWAEGRTGIPFIDANMKELRETGFMSNRGRQNVASFLIKDLKLDWRMGAEFFESMLIDYDPCSNYGNWAYLAGVGVDPREDRYFNIIVQAKRYDSQGAFVKHWLPQLSEIPCNYVHVPDQLSLTEAESYHVKIGKDYPQAIVSTSRWD